MTSCILVSLRVKASPDRAFEVFTQEIGRWWRPGMLFQLTPRGDGILRFEGGEGGRLVSELPGGKLFEVGRIRVWEPPHRFVVGWRQATFTPDQDTELEVSFHAVGEETRVTVEHRGWDVLPLEHVARHRFPEPVLLARIGDWWRSELTALGCFTSERDA